MDEEKLLTSLKDGGKMDALLCGVESYFMPVSKTKSKLTSSVANKYGVFAMKALRACIQRLTDTKPGSQDFAGILQISEKSYQCVCKAREHIKTIPLALEKLLFHTMAQTLNKRLLADAQRVASFLYDELSKSRSDFLTDSGVDNEYDTIVKQAFNQLWKACLDLEQSSQAQYTLKHTLILNVRLQALQFLVLTNYECSWVVERALRAAVDFDRKSSKSAADQEQLQTFLKTVLDLLLVSDQKAPKGKEKSIDKNTAQLFELGLQAIKYSVRAMKFDHALEICGNLEVSLQQPGNKGTAKQEGMHSQCLVLIKSALQLKQHLSKQSHHPNKDKKNKTSSSQVDSIADTIHSITTNVSKVLEKTTISGPNLTCLLDACDILKKSLEGTTDSDQQKAIPSQLPKVFQDPIYTNMMLFVDLLQLQKEQLSTSVKESREAAKNLSQQMQRNVNRQLTTLDFLSTMTLENIKVCSQDAGTEWEGCLKRAVEVCKRTKNVIDDVATGGGGALPTEENRWFGSSAYNLGLVCYRRKCYPQAATLLDIACNQLQTWCFTGGKVDLDKIKKVQLLTRYEFLIDCHRKAGQHTQAMETTVKCLWEVCSHMTDQVTPCIELWVKAKRDALKNDGNEQLQSRTLFDAIKDMGGTLSEEHRDFISLLLKKELQAYKALRHDTTVEQHSVVCDLLNLNSSDDSKLAYCHGLVEQAQLLRIGNFESDKSACECCSEAIDILTEVAQDASTSEDGSNDPQGLVAFDVLATAYFWMYVCQMEEIQLSTAKPPAESKSESETETKPSNSAGGVVPHVACNLGMEQANMQYLDMALGIWADLLCNGFKPDVFHELSVSSQCLKLMASLFELTQKPLQQLQSLHLLSVLSTASGNRSQAVYAFCQLSHTLCYIGETKLAGNILWKAEDLMQQGDADGASDGGCSQKNLELSCMMAKAEFLLYDGKFDSFQSKLEKLTQSQTSERRTYHTYLQNACIKELQATCMDISTEVMTSDLCPAGLTSLELAVEAMRLRMGVCSNLLGEYFCNSKQQADGAKANTSTIESNTQEDLYDQWSILSAVLQSLLQVGKLYRQQGCVREAECYLHEGLVIANQYLLPRRCAEFSLQLSKVYTMKGQQCQAQLTQMKHFVDSSKETKIINQDQSGATEKGIVKSKKKSSKRPSSRTSVAANSDDENFIQSKRLSLSYILSTDDVTSSPTLKSQIIKLPEYHKHGSDCGCESCADIMLHQLDLEYFAAQARSSLMQSELLEALSEVDTAMQFANLIVDRDDKTILNTLKSLTDDQDKGDSKSSKKKKNCKSHPDSTPRTAHFHDQRILELNTLKVRVLLQQNKHVKAQQCIGDALAMFTKEGSPVVLPAISKAELQFYQVMANLSQQGCDVFTNAWKCLQRQSVESVLPNDMEDLSTQIAKLDLSETATGGKSSSSRNHSVGWEDRLEGAGRPELARKDLVTPAAQVFTSGGIGIFCDPSDDDEDGVEKQQEGACAIMNTPKPSRASVKASTKKGVFSYSVKKKAKTPMVVWEDESTNSKETLQEPVSAFSLDNDVFGFDSPSLTSKKGKSTRKTKSAKSVTASNRKGAKSRQKSQPKVTFVDSDDAKNRIPRDEDVSQSKAKSSRASVFSLDNDLDFEQEHSNGSKSNSKRKNTSTKRTVPVNDDKQSESERELVSVHKSTARKRSTAASAKKKPAFVLSESDADQNEEQADISKGRKPSRKKSVPVKDNGEDIKQDVSDVKPNSRGRGRKKVTTPKDADESVADMDEIVAKKPTRQRRGRKPNIENTRADDDELALDSFQIVMEANGILPIDTPDDISDVSCHSYSDLDLRRDASKDADASISDSLSAVEVTISSTVSDMLLLEDVDEIEIPRAGSDSDDEDCGRGGRRKKTTSKKSTGRRRTTKKTKELDEEDAVEMLRTSTQVSEEVSGKQRSKKNIAAKQIQGAISDSDLAPLIEQLEQVYNTIKHSAPVVLYRQVCHMLALCYGDQAPTMAVHYLNEAMAVTLRHKKITSLAKKIKKIKKESSATSDVDQLSDNLAKMSLVPDNSRRKKKSAAPTPKPSSSSGLDVLEEGRKMFAFQEVMSQTNGSDVVQETIKALPEGWTVCMLSVVSPSAYSGKVPADSDFLVVSRLAQNKPPVLIKVPMGQSDFGFIKSSQDILEEFDAIMVENKESVKETDKRVWWSCRQKLDERMETLTTDMENSLFGCWKGMLLGQDRDQQQRTKLEQSAKELQTAIEASCQVDIDQHLCECLLASANKLSKQQLNTAISCLSGLRPGSDEHAGLTVIFRQLATKLGSTTEDARKRHPVVLILDKQIQQLPWENMPIVKAQPICRMPSLHFIHAHLKATQCQDTVLSQGVNTSDTFFVLNPTNDLANTQKTFQKWFEKDNGWKGVVARAPTKEEYMSALTEHDLFVYCGHGTGREFLTGDDIQRLTCQAATLLIGCSSGKLHVNGCLEAYGMALNYLVAGSPCVVANLWDVTDKDIDRFLEELLKSWLASDKPTSLPDYINQARQTCKLEYLIGCSPVVYGLPVHIKN